MTRVPTLYIPVVGVCALFVLLAVFLLEKVLSFETEGKTKKLFKTFSKFAVLKGKIRRKKLRGCRKKYSPRAKYNAKRGSLDYCRGDPRGDAAHHSLLAEIICANSRSI